jgi:Ca2+-binding RTX toxin-like protein
VAEHQAIERAVAASGRAKRALRDRRWFAYTGLVTALLLVSLVFSLVLATAAIAGRLNKIDGTASADRIRGTSASDRIRGGEGNDILRGWAGDDRLVGGPDDDVLVGGPGRDSYVCGGGEDVVVVDLFRHAEHFGNGCEVAVFDV